MTERQTAGDGETDRRADGTGWNGTGNWGKPLTGRDGTGQRRDGTGRRRDGTGRDGTGRDGTGRDGTGPDSGGTGQGIYLLHGIIL